jgi:hypothetical protein
MRDDRLNQLCAGYAADDYSATSRPAWAASALAEREELAGSMSRLAGRCPQSTSCDVQGRCSGLR